MPPQLLGVHALPAGAAAAAHAANAAVVATVSTRRTRDQPAAVGPISATTGAVPV